MSVRVLASFDDDTEGSAFGEKVGVAPPGWSVIGWLASRVSDEGFTYRDGSAQRAAIEVEVLDAGNTECQRRRPAEGLHPVVGLVLRGEVLPDPRLHHIQIEAGREFLQVFAGV